MNNTDRMPSWHSYPKIYSLGHAAVSDLLKGDVTIEEKVDGSQFSFGADLDGRLRVRSKGVEFPADAPERMFSSAVATARDLLPSLTPGWTYRCEYLQKPKHNTLAYERTPTRSLIVFDVNTGHESYLAPEERRSEAQRIGLEVVPILRAGPVRSADDLRSILDTPSVLGAQKIEGVVVKPVGYGIYGPDKKVLMGKFVSEAFKEIHGKEWRKSNPTNGDMLLEIIGALRSESRWAKAVQHLAERGEITDSPKDIGSVLKEIVADVEAECGAEIAARLFAWAWPRIRREIVRGAPEWYKGRLLERQFEQRP